MVIIDVRIINNSDSIMSTILSMIIPITCLQALSQLTHKMIVMNNVVLLLFDVFPIITNRTGNHNNLTNDNRDIGK